MEDSKDEKKHHSENSNIVFGTSTAVMIFALLWFLAGLIAFIWSLVCFAKSGTTADKVLGLLLAFFFGPLYFFYLGFYKSYCRSETSNFHHKN